MAVSDSWRVNETEENRVFILPVAETEVTCVLRERGMRQRRVKLWKSGFLVPTWLSHFNGRRLEVPLMERLDNHVT